MGMSVSDLAWVRAHVGALPDDTTLNTNFTRLGGRAKVALEIWQTRYADFVRVAASQSVDTLSKNTSANITAAEKMVKQLELAVRREDAEDEGLMGRSGFLYRQDRTRRYGCSEEQILSRYC